MIYINVKQAIFIHNTIMTNDNDCVIQGMSGYGKNIIYLESALEQIKNDDFYPTFADKLTHIMFACIKFHPFNDGNKRTSIFLAMHFLNLNGMNIENFAEEFEDVVVEVASDKISKEDLKHKLNKFIQDSKKIL